MQTIRDHQSGLLFDPWGYLGPQRRRLLDRSWAGVFRDYLLVYLPVKKLATLFSEDQGRPSKDLFMVMGALILQQLHDLTDEQTTEAVALNIAWHYALDIRQESDAYLCERTLRNYRARVLELGLDEALFHTLTDQLITRIGVDTSRQRLDSTAVRSAIRGLTRLGILVEATSRFLRELKRACPVLHGEVAEDILRRYVERQGDGCFANTRPSESQRRLPEAAQDVYRLLEQFRETEATQLENYQLLQRIFDEQCEVIEEETASVVIRPPKTTGCDQIVHPADPDARYNKHKGTGYAVQIMETFDDQEPPPEESEIPKPDLITHVAVDPLNKHDKEALLPALQETGRRDVKPNELLVDSHYGSMECLEQAQKQGVNVVAPAQTPKGKLQGKLTLEDCELDAEGRVTRCPAGHAPVETRVADIRLQVLFDAAVCDSCPDKDRCPLAAVGRRHARYQYTHDRVRQYQRRKQEETEAFRDRYRWRAGVEATMSRFKHQMGMAKLRVRGLKRIRFVARLRALGLNLRRVAAYRVACE